MTYHPGFFTFVAKHKTTLKTQPSQMQQNLHQHLYKSQMTIVFSTSTQTTSHINQHAGTLSLLKNTFESNNNQLQNHPITVPYHTTLSFICTANSLYHITPPYHTIKPPILTTSLHHRTHHTPLHRITPQPTTPHPTTPQPTTPHHTTPSYHHF